MKYKLLLLIIVVILGQCTPKNTPKRPVISNREDILFPKRQFRAAWIATIDNIDWPSKRTLSSDQQQNEFVGILDTHKKIGINAVFVQVRAASDAFYANSNEPWSEWLTGTQGKAPEPFYDPMKFMIDETHDRNMEFHAWLNLNRGTQKNAKSLSNDHITKLHPEWFINYGGSKLYNFGLPEVREYIEKVAVNVVKNYDVDGLHFDDYFYPYAIEGETFDDSETFKEYGSEFSNIGDWRRNNINTLIRDLSKAINGEKRWVKFGISPAGVWRNESSKNEGSPTRGLSSYDDLYADTRKWVNSGWIDYIAPQVYFAFDHVRVPYKSLVDWWSENHGNRHLYIGHSVYKVDKNSTEKSWKTAGQIGKQIRSNLKSREISGSVFFSSKYLVANNLGISDTLKNIYKYPALLPSMPWKDGMAPNSPTSLQVKRNDNNGSEVTWKLPSKLTLNRENIQSFVLYRFEEFEEINLENPKKIVSIIRNVGVYKYEDKNASKRKSYYYVITALDRLHNESGPSNQFYLK